MNDKNLNPNNQAIICAINTEEFIAKVQQQPVLWDRLNEDYKNHRMRMRAWTNIARKFIDDFDNLIESDQNDLYKKLTNRWRSIRDNYVRHVNRKDRSKTYRHAKLLTFMKIERKRKSDNESDSEEDTVADVTAVDKVSESSNQSDDDDSFAQQSKRRKTTIEIANVVSKQEPKDVEFFIGQEPMVDVNESPSCMSSYPVQEDRAFFDSLLPAVSTLDMDQKLHFRSQVINLLRCIRKGSDRLSLNSSNCEFLAKYG